MHTPPRMFRALFETAPDAMVVIDLAGFIVLANPQAARRFGYANGELVGQAVEVLIPHNAHAAHRDHRDRYMSAPRERPMGAGQELTGLRQDGSEFPVEIALSPIHTEEGAYFVASIRDISDTHRARQALARARYDTFVAQAGQLALESSIELTLDRLPEMIASALGIDAVLVVFGRDSGRELQVRVVHGVLPQELDALMEDLAQGEGPAERSARVQPSELALTALASGHSFRSGLCARLFDADRSMGSLIALAHQAHVFDREAAHFLQSVTNLLAAALQRHHTQEQLAHAQRLEAVGQLTGGIAHDFNNLLTVISGNLQLLEAEVGDRDDMLPIIGSALRAVGRGAELTRKLLAFARRQRLSPRPIAPVQLLADLGLMLRRTLGEQVDLDLDCPEQSSAVYADPAQLEAALINLALNARDAMPRGGRLRISVSEAHIDDTAARDEVHAGHYVVFRVSDTGVGMAPEVLARAFEPFFTTKDPGKGSGLGLSLVYGFVKQSGGHIRSESRAGQGTRIELFLPRAAHSVAPLPKANAAAESMRGNESVLVVEDEPEVRLLVIAFLRSLGYTVLAAANAIEGQELLDANPQIELLFSDVILGAGCTGAELARDARRLRPGLSILLTSGYEQPAAEAQVQPGSEFALLRKPYTREELGAAVRLALEKWEH